MESLFTERDPSAGTDPELDALLEQAFSPQRSASPPKRSGTRLHLESPALLKAYWAVCAVLLLALIQMGCNAGRLASTANAAKPTFNTLPTKLHPGLEPSVATVESELPPTKSMTWVREDEPTIEVTGPEPAEPFADWAPRAVLERLPAPRAQLVSLPVRRAEVVRLSR
jgi:hypothetical protein